MYNVNNPKRGRSRIVADMVRTRLESASLGLIAATLNTIVVTQESRTMVSHHTEI